MAYPCQQKIILNTLAEAFSRPPAAVDGAILLEVWVIVGTE
jgi:hypothetical protein